MFWKFWSFQALLGIDYGHNPPKNSRFQWFWVKNRKNRHILNIFKSRRRASKCLTLPILVYSFKWSQTVQNWLKLCSRVHFLSFWVLQGQFLTQNHWKIAIFRRAVPKIDPQKGPKWPKFSKNVKKWWETVVWSHRSILGLKERFFVKIPYFGAIWPLETPKTATVPPLDDPLVLLNGRKKNFLEAT